MNLEENKNKHEGTENKPESVNKEQSFEDEKKLFESEIGNDFSELSASTEDMDKIERSVKLTNPEEVEAIKKELNLDGALADIDEQAEKLKNETENALEWIRLDNHVFDEDSFYRIVNENGFQDYQENKILRSSRTGTEPEMAGRFNIGNRPTAFPSFDKGAPDLSYAKKGEDNYIFESKIPMYKRGDKHPITNGIIKGRHWAYRPIDLETGKTILEIKPDMINNIYKIDKEGDLFLKK